MGLFSRGGPKVEPLTPAPKVADLPPARLQHAGRYLGTLAGEQRVRARGLGPASAARIQLSDQGVDVIRLAGSFRIPADELRSARGTAEFDRAPVEGALVIRWQHGEDLLDTGFRLDPASGSGAGTHREWSRAVAKVGQKTGPKTGRNQG